jgi:hypothetical protein
LRIYFVPILVLVACLALFFLVTFPKISSIIRLRKQLGSLKNQEQNMVDKIQLIVSLDEEETQKYMRLVNLAIPRQKDISLILFSINSPARKEGFLIDKLEFNLGELKNKAENATSSALLSDRKKKLSRVKKSKASNNLERINVDLNLVGRQSNLVKLIRDFEQSLPLLGLKSLDATIGKSEKISLKMNLTMFFFPEVNLPQLEKIPLDQLALSSGEKEQLDELSQFYRHDVALFGTEGESESPSIPRDNPFMP